MHWLLARGNYIEGVIPLETLRLKMAVPRMQRGAYLTAATAWSVPRELKQIVMSSAEEWWPWPTSEWQPENSALGNLHQALALLLAETERLERHRHTWRRPLSLPAEVETH